MKEFTVDPGASWSRSFISQMSLSRGLDSPASSGSGYCVLKTQRLSAYCKHICGYLFMCNDYRLELIPVLAIDYKGNITVLDPPNTADDTS